MILANQVEIQLTINADEYLKMYQGRANDVVARAVDGRRIRFPARILQRFVTREGVSGAFIITFDEANRFRSIERKLR
ncbi:DUF2835 domain-containing protein [Teredinibacter turnerae]|uniref:DUF2835 domain-containing protein n=1 Tax=Teredinibacter turnerae TaxID=2426 RepID=UPI00037380BD|nr:DUF2835 domain-containing protein [Teredinibacter turnerae]